jgi:hypothetical protein
MVKKIQTCLLVVMSLLLTSLLGGCGSDNKEGNGTPSTVARVADEGTCRVCHADSVDPVSGTLIVADFLTSAHNGDAPLGCQGCHGGGAEHFGIGPIPFPNPLTSNICITCHNPNGVAQTDEDLTALFETAKAGFVTQGCAHCHTASGVGSVHGAQVPTSDDCVFCHSVAAPQHGADLVGDNNGVRAITTEFAKWSHHVTGVTLDKAHCVACHLEGSAVNGQIVVDQTKHMVDNKIHLRNADTDAEMLWDPAAPNFTTMDNFCLSCHDANGATSPISAQIQGIINGTGLNATGKRASATNPFGDTISNRYDKMQRPGVVDANSQFNTTNNSHHGVKGKRYSGRTRLAGLRQIASPNTFAANSTAILKGARSTIYDAGNFNALYVPLGTDGTAATGLGDDSTLHCGDCHTVGQWKVGSSVDINGDPTTAAIGAHGSNNEYLLRNTIGTDQRHTQNAFLLSSDNVVTYTNPGGPFLVCYNCHAYSKYGSIFVGTGLNSAGTFVGVQPHAGEYDQAGRCNGIGNTLPFNGYTTGKATDGTQFVSRFMSVGNPATPTQGSPPTQLTYAPPAPYPGEQGNDFGNIFGIQCLNCHNSGAGNAYGGIHGSARNTNTVTATVNPAVTGGAYIDGMGNTTKVERFLPGLGDAMHVPGTLGGYTGGGTIATTVNLGAGNYTYTTGAITNDTNWEQKFWQQTATTNFDLTGKTAPVGVSAGAGCYTLGASTNTATNITAGIRGPSVTGEGGAATTLYGTWGGCVDHTAGQGEANHGFVKRIVRPVTY